MTRRDWLRAAGVGLGPALIRSDGASRPPNLLVVLADDLGYGELGCFGNKIVRTPHLDRFAAEGARFTNCYAAAANCSPARTGLMTGRTPTRVGIHNWIPMLSPMHVKTGELTVASLLRRAGYATCHIGKWHLNGWFNLPGQPQPSDHGFDYWYSTQNNALPNHRHPYNFVRNRVPMGPQEGYAAEIVAREAIQWLRKERDPAKPFFQYVCFHEPHEPIATARRHSDLYPSGQPSYSAYYGNITQLDAGVGRILQTLDELKLRDNTVVLFTSDNGPAATGMHPYGDKGLLREKKGHMYEGGIRVPGILRWPGRSRAGQVIDEPVCGVDLLPTACEIAGVQTPADRALDGVSFLPALEGRPLDRKTPLYWHFNHASGTPKVAMRMGDWKLLARLTGPNLGPGAAIRPEEQQAIKTAELAGFELYNLCNDIGERNDLASREAARLKEMTSVLEPLYREVRGESPTWPAWEFPRYEAERIEWPPYWKPPARP